MKSVCGPLGEQTASARGGCGSGGRAQSLGMGSVVGTLAQMGEDI